jgi:WD40 repeat protein
VLEVLGRGGMGVVLKAFDPELKRCVAIKALAPHLAQSSLAKQRFAREAQAAAAVVHPNVMAIHQVRPVGRLPFLVMPLVAGESLAERLARRGSLDLTETLRIGMQTAAALDAAHEQGLVHRDVKPANILLEKGVERVLLADFGLARAGDDVALTRWGIIAGTPQYMSPEQARGEPLDGRSDLFSLGCILYEMATGVSPFRADSVMATMRRLVEESPPAMTALNPQIPRWFVALVGRLLEKDPARRFVTAKDVAALLEGCLAHVQQPDGAPLPTELAALPAARNSGWRRKGAIAMIGTTCALALAVALWQSAAKHDGGAPVAKTKAAEEGKGRVAGPGGDDAGPVDNPRILTVFRVPHSVETMAISRDGSLVAIANGNPTRIMMTSGRSRLAGDWKPTLSVFDPIKGKRIFESITSDEELASLEETHRVPGLEITALEFSPDGTKLAVGTSIGQVRIVNARTGIFIHELDDRKERAGKPETLPKLQGFARAIGSVHSLAFSPDGTRIAVCGPSIAETPLVVSETRELGGLPTTGPGRVKVFDAESGAPLRDLVGHSQAEGVAYSHDGTTIVSIGRWSGPSHGTGAIAWDVESGRELATVSMRASGGARRIAVSPSANLAAVGLLEFDKENGGSRWKVAAVYPKTGITEWSRTLPGARGPLAFDPGGAGLWTPGPGRTLQAYDVKTGAGRAALSAPEENNLKGGEYLDLVVAPAGRRMALAERVPAGRSPDASYFVELWEFPKPPQPAAKP